jgi:hypothetical protein
LRSQPIRKLGFANETAGMKSPILTIRGHDTHIWFGWEPVWFKFDFKFYFGVDFKGLE